MPTKSRRVPFTLPQWPCADCGSTITRNRAYRAYELWSGVRTLVGRQRHRNGAYCHACASRQAHATNTGACVCTDTPAQEDLC